MRLRGSLATVSPQLANNWSVHENQLTLKRIISIRELCQCYRLLPEIHELEANRQPKIRRIIREKYVWVTRY